MLQRNEKRGEHMCKELCPDPVYNVHTVNKNCACCLSDPLTTPWLWRHQSIQPSSLTDGGPDGDSGRDRHTELWESEWGSPSSGPGACFAAPHWLAQLGDPVLLPLTQWAISWGPAEERGQPALFPFLSGPKAIFFLSPSSPSTASFIFSPQLCFMPSSAPVDTAWTPQSFYFSPVGSTARYACSFLRLKPWDVCT